VDDVAGEFVEVHEVGLDGGRRSGEGALAFCGADEVAEGPDRSVIHVSDCREEDWMES
jgi:hypothetical protein